MQPQLFRIPLPGGHEVPIFSYGVMIMLGFVFAILYASWRAKREGIDPNYVLDIGLYAVVAGILGSRAMYYWEFYRKPFEVAVAAGTPGAVPTPIEGKIVYLKLLSFAERPWYTFFFIHEGGIVFYGGFLLAAAVIVFYLWWSNRKLVREGRGGLPVLRVCDALACAVPIGLAFGRVGCFLNGCCWGRVAGPHALLAIQFPRYSPAWQSQVHQRLIEQSDAFCRPVHATQLYECGAALLIAAVLFLYYRVHSRDGQLFAMLAVLYGPVRYVIEGLREHDPNAERTQIALAWLVDPIAGQPMTNSQLVSLGILAAGLACWGLATRFGPRYAPAETGRGRVDRSVAARG
jgi:phosphatidylglycerol:prolipoprotein diacylglycerol transferase